jgi:hypothetical protein
MITIQPGPLGAEAEWRHNLKLATPGKSLGIMKNLREGEDRIEQGNWGTFATREVPTSHQMEKSH